MMGSRIRSSEALRLMQSVRFMTLVLSPAEFQPAYRMVSSLKVFGGKFSRCPVWVLTPDLPSVQKAFQIFENVRVVLLEPQEELDRYPFGRKVSACAQAEKMSPDKIRALVWLDPTCLVIQPPDFFDLPTEISAAFRPVHIRNIGSPAGETKDPFWSGIYEAVGIRETPFTIESFIDAQVLRPYFNTHLFAINPSARLMQRWQELFRELILDDRFQDLACQDPLHRIFLHQAALSTLVIQTLEPAQIRILPAMYSYPLHLHSRVPENRRVCSLEETICPVYEDQDSRPESVAGLEIGEQLLSWLEANTWNPGSA